MDRAVVGVGVGFYTLFSDIAQSSLCFQRVFTSEVYQAKLNANSIASIQVGLNGNFGKIN